MQQPYGRLISADEQTMWKTFMMHITVVDLNAAMNNIQNMKMCLKISLQAQTVIPVECLKHFLQSLYCSW